MAGKPWSGERLTILMAAVQRQLRSDARLQSDLAGGLVSTSFDLLEREGRDLSLITEATGMALALLASPIAGQRRLPVSRFAIDL